MLSLHPSSHTSEETALYACKHLLQYHTYTTQEEIRLALVELGYKSISQSTVSRILSRLGVAKMPNHQGKKVYRLAGNLEPLELDTSVYSQIESILTNQATVIVKTLPGSATLIARMIDAHPHPDILATLSGGDTVFIAPKDIHSIDRTLSAVRKLFSYHH